MNRNVVILYSSRFKSDYKKAIKHHKDLPKLLDEILTYLKDGEKIPERFKDHQLSGRLAKYRECHLKNDLLLMYNTIIYSIEITGETIEIKLARVGSHSELFK